MKNKDLLKKSQDLALKINNTGGLSYYESFDLAIKIIALDDNYGNSAEIKASLGLMSDTIATISKDVKNLSK